MTGHVPEGTVDSKSTGLRRFVLPGAVALMLLLGAAWRYVAETSEPDLNLCDRILADLSLYQAAHGSYPSSLDEMESASSSHPNRWSSLTGWKLHYHRAKDDGPMLMIENQTQGRRYFYDPVDGWIFQEFP